MKTKYPALMATVVILGTIAEVVSVTTVLYVAFHFITKWW